MPVQRSKIKLLPEPTMLKAMYDGYCDNKLSHCLQFVQFGCKILVQSSLVLCDFQAWRVKAMTGDEVNECLIGALAEHRGVSVETVSRQLEEANSGIDSLEGLVLAMAVQNRFGVVLTDEEAASGEVLRSLSSLSAIVRSRKSSSVS